MTTCTTDDTRTMVRGTTEYLSVTLTADVQLDVQVVEFSLDDQATWLTAEAVGAAGLVRTYRHLLVPAEQPAASSVEVLVRITDTSETPIISAGWLTIA